MSSLTGQSIAVVASKAEHMWRVCSARMWHNARFGRPQFVQNVPIMQADSTPRIAAYISANTLQSICTALCLEAMRLPCAPVAPLCARI
jgi:hypothetical protein